MGGRMTPTALSHWSGWEVMTAFWGLTLLVVDGPFAILQAGKRLAPPHLGYPGQQRRRGQPGGGEQPTVLLKEG